ncbi:hypothetical protein QBC44DRAFT_297102 [Cladorrhinum sp. PSN332]|nr:hypothetical protein QBC44DRAFT_297102 [Cladorrhinum sp. PSN332]
MEEIAQLRRFIICVDYGTTYTGVAWILTNPPNRPTVGDITIVQKWTQDHGTENQYKVPSEYTYSANPGERWGFNIAHTAYILKWTKLQLEVPSRLAALRSMKRSLQEAEKLEIYPEQQTREIDIPDHITKTASEIVTDYLQEVMIQVRKDIEWVFRNDRKPLEQFPIDLIITHPAKWDQRGRNLTFRAVNHAFNSAFKGINILKGRIRLATEPEACAQYTLQGARADRILSTPQLRLEECFIVVDAGGGTVDLVSYQIHALEPEFVITKITPVSGAACGATLIDRCFLNEFLEQRLGTRNYQRLLSMGRGRDTHGSSNHTVHKIGEQYMLEQFQLIKHQFSGPLETGQPFPDMVLGLPAELQFRDDPVRRIRNGQLLISCKDMETMFQDCIEGISKLIKRQLRLIAQKRTRDLTLKVRTIFLSGGFSQNEYLFKCVKKLARDHQSEVVRARNPSTAVAGGGVLLGLGLECKIPPFVVECPYSLGVKASKDFAGYDHTEEQRYTDPLDGVMRARNHVEWFSFKGDLIEKDIATNTTINLSRKFTKGGSKSGRVTIVVSPAGDPQKPSPKDGLPWEVCIDFDLLAKVPHDDIRRLLKPGKPSKTRQPYEELALQLEVSIRQTVADIELVCGQTVTMTGQVNTRGYLLGRETIQFPASTESLED